MLRFVFLIGLVFTAAPAAAGALEKANDYDYRQLNSPAAIVQRFNLYAAAVKENPDSYEANWKASKFGYYVWQFAAPKDKRLDVAKVMLRYAKKATELKRDGAEGWHWFAIGVGTFGLTKGLLDSLHLIPDFRNAMEKSIALDPNHYFSSGQRMMGRLYTILPGPPVSIGSREKAMEHLQTVAKKRPGFALTDLYLADWFWKNGANDKALALLEQALTKSRSPSNEGEFIFAGFVREKAAKIRKMILDGESRGLFDPMTD